MFRTVVSDSFVTELMKNCTPLGGFFGSFECRIYDKEDLENHSSQLELCVQQEKNLSSPNGQTEEAIETQNLRNE